MQTCMGLFLSRGCFGLVPVLCSERKAVLRSVACDQVLGARGRGQGTETLAQLVWQAAWAEIMKNEVAPQVAAEKAFKRVEEIFAKYPIAEG